MSDVSSYLMVSVKSSCRDIMCESVPGSPPPFLLFVKAMGEPWNEASYNLVKTLLQPADSFNFRVSDNHVTALLQPCQHGCCHTVRIMLITIQSWFRNLPPDYSMFFILSFQNLARHMFFFFS